MLPSASDCFKLYVSNAYSYPVLTREEEFSYAKKMSSENCLDSAKKLISSHLRYVIAIAKGYSGYGLPADDLIQEGTVGLMKATKSFDHLKGNRLSTFSAYWIKAEMLEFILKNFKTAKIATTKEQRKVFFNLRSLKKSNNWLTKKETLKIAETLNVKPQTVSEMESRLASRVDISINANEDDGEEFSGIDHILEDGMSNVSDNIINTQNSTFNNAVLAKSMEMLTFRENDIINSRWLSNQKTTLKELACKYDISIERARQVEKGALKKLNTAMTDNV